MRMVKVVNDEEQGEKWKLRKMLKRMGRKRMRLYRASVEEEDHVACVWKLRR